MWVRLFPLILVYLLIGVPVDAQVLDEAGSSAVVIAPNADIVLVIDAPAPIANTRADLELVDQRDAVRARVTRQLDLKAGKHKYPVRIPLADLVKLEGEDSIGWYRVRYRIGEASGIVSMSELLKDVFELRAAASDQVVPGSVYRMRVSAINPFTNQRVRSVAIDGKLELDTVSNDVDDEITIAATAVTNKEGIAVLNFKIPAGIRLDMDPEFELVGRRNGVVRKIENDFEMPEKPGVFFTSDKPMYQPGETFNLRGLFLDAQNTVIAGHEVKLAIEDEEDTRLYSETVTTSEYGIASISWKIPADAKLGKYQVELDDDEQFTFKVTRYDLPNFVVTAEADKGYYLITEKTASITVGADYLFGKPVARGKVRVVQEDEREWNWKEQKYDVDEGAEVEGETDAAGKYVARIDLTEEIEELEQSEYLRFKDLHFAAYFTDTSTNRTEEKRFDVRITKEPIHVHLIWYAEQSPDLPMIGYVSTFYADGTPAACSVELTNRNSTVDSIETNSLGAGKFKFAIPEGAFNDRKFKLKIAARDRQGRRGTFYEDLELTKDDAIQIETDKAVYKPRDVIKVDLISTQRTGLVYVDLIKDDVVLESRHANLRNGKADLLFGYSTQFKGALTIAAYNDTKYQWNEPQMRFARGVIFPERADFRLDAKFDRKTYRPGEDGRLRLTVSDGVRPAESALGITIFDQAIEERARTDGEFRDYFGGFAKLMGLDRGYGGITLRDLNNIDVAKPVSDEMQLAAEVILAASQHRATVYHSSFDAEDAHTFYSEYFKKQTGTIERVLKARFDKDFTYPTDEASLVTTLKAGGIDTVVDPWGQAYIPAFRTDRSHLVLRLNSKGPDKRGDTPDDFNVMTTRFEYFSKLGREIDRAVTEEYLATGEIIRTVEKFNEVVKRRGVDPRSLVDPWKRAYRVSFGRSARNHVIRISSLGPDGVPAERRWGGDDFEVANIYIDQFAKTEEAIHSILRRAAISRKFPSSVTEFASVLSAGGLDLTSIRDTAGEPVYVTASVRRQYISEQTTIDGKTVSRSVPVNALMFMLRSRGDDKVDAADDVDFAWFSELSIKENAAFGGSSSATMTSTETSGAKGAISGVVTDPNGAVIPGIEIVAFQAGDENVIFAATTDEEGKFLLANLPSGRYTLIAKGASGFTDFRQSDIIVRSQRLIEMEITLQVATVSAMVDVVASGDVDQTTNFTSSNISTRRSSSAGKILFPSLEESATPRLREYFPETLLWQPQLVTDRRGRADVNFKVADNITTWKMYAIASTKNGKVGVAEKEFTAFQPFFVDLDPPKFLTTGDSISLPVQVRNYTEQRQTVDVSMARADWFSITGADRQSIDVDAAGSKNAVFTFRAASPVKAGKQRVTAMAKRESDAIEKPVTVRPDGHEVVRTQSKLFHGSETIKLDFPANALALTPNAALKIYPNLFSHVTESVEGLLQRPYGCGEQTISSTYPNVMILKFLKGDSPLRQKAQDYLKTGYQRLIGYQVADGGFSYWGGKDSSNIALTAYALRFLNDAKEFIDVDSEVVRRAESYLMSQQQADGSWPYRYATNEPGRIAMATAYVARSIAMRKATDKNAALQKAFSYLDAHKAEITDPHTLALFGLAALDAGDAAMAKTIAERLQKTGVAEDGSEYWDLTSSTLFYGWGKTGRIETTALVLQLLTRTLGPGAGGGGTLYLLRNKDRYGVWYSTQTTINVLDALIVIQAVKPESNTNSIEVLLNGASVQTVAVEGSNAAPVTIELAGKLNPSSNTIEIRGASGTPVMVQTVATHYIAWADVPADTKSPMVLNYKCDKVDAAIMAEISCSVEAGRRSTGYGMLLAEIGLPPGAAVNRESLDRLIHAGSPVSR